MSPDEPPPGSDDSPEDDKALWQNEIRNVKTLADDARVRPQTISRTSLKIRPRAAAAAQSSPPQAGNTAGPGLDHRTAKRLQQGKMDIEDRLDLHGKTLTEARIAVTGFIQRAAAEEKRCLLIITGKGQEQSQSEDVPWYISPRGQIRQALPAWLEDAALKPLILSVAAAKPEHGGSGAVYVLLRRKR